MGPPPLPQRNDRNSHRRAHAGWTGGMLALAASDLADLEKQGAADTVGSLIEISQKLDREDFLIMNLEYLAPEGSTATLVDRMEMLRRVITDTAAKMNLDTPRYAIEERGESLDLRVRLDFH